MKRIKDDSVGLVLIGKGPSRNDTLEKIKEYGLEDKILTFESVPNKNLISVYKRANVFLLPTNYEIYGMVVMEALLYGVPVISTPEAGPEFLLSSDVYGKCEKLDVAKWINAIKFYLSNYTSEEDRASRTRYVESNFRWNSIAEKYYETINKLIKK